MKNSENKTNIHDLSTDDDEYVVKNKLLPSIQEKEVIEVKEGALKADKYGNTPLSLAIEDGNISVAREMYPLDKGLSVAEFFKRIALDMTSPELQNEYKITPNVALNIYSESKYQLNLMGEDTSEIVEAYNFE